MSESSKPKVDYWVDNLPDGRIRMTLDITGSIPEVIKFLTAFVVKSLKGRV